MNKFAFSLLLSAALIGCSAGTSSNGGGTVFDPPPVQAATYSNASVTGTYAVNFTQGYFGATTTSLLTSIGTFVADGAGNITSGTLTEYAGGTPCTESLTGTYNVRSDASGSVTVTATPSGATPCTITAPGTIKLIVQAAQQGQALLITENDTSIIATGTALRQ